MNKLFLRSTAFLTASLLFAAPVQTAAEGEETADLTVTVCHSDTGALFDVPGVQVLIMGSTPEEFARGFMHVCGQVDWEAGNPCTVTVEKYHPDWVYEFELHDRSFGDYWYDIDTERTDVRFALSPDETTNVTLYLEKKYPESAFGGMFICRGTYGEEQYPLFEYFYPSRDAFSGYAHYQLCYTGELPETPQYGDVYTTELPVLPDRSGSINTLDSETPLTRQGTCGELYETVPMTIVHVGSFSANPDPQEILLSDPDGHHYWFQQSSEHISTPLPLADVRLGDTLDFALYQEKVPILPLTAPVHAQTVPGDVNFDRDIDSGDIGSLQDHLHGVASDIQPDLSVSDLNGDREVDVFDLCLLKRQVSDSLASKPHITMQIFTQYGGAGVDGHDLGSGSFTTRHEVFGETQFYETGSGHFLKNALDPFTYTDKILTVESFDENGVTVTCFDRGDTAEKTIPYGEELLLDTTNVIYDGINYSYAVTFTDTAKE